ncbi:hypothetical protein HanPSC8_Chr16g0704931 [Helianthus annuus]|nr:hypothetical protein HanPSC8_Chr16g0704931 [Helianthus annuus]
MFNQNGSLSFSDMVGNNGASSSSGKTAREVGKGKLLNIQDEMRAFQELYGRALVGRVIDFKTLKELKRLLKDEGLGGMNNIGGMTLMLKFSNKIEAENMTNRKEAWSRWFLRLETWEGQVLPFERIAWLMIHGVPPHLLENWVFDYIAGQFGPVLHPSQMDMEEDDLSTECVGILVRGENVISDSVTLKWRDRKFKVGIQEETGEWEPDCLGFVEHSEKLDFPASRTTTEDRPAAVSPDMVSGENEKVEEKEEGEINVDSSEMDVEKVNSQEREKTGSTIPRKEERLPDMGDN